MFISSNALQRDSSSPAVCEFSTFWVGSNKNGVTHFEFRLDVPLRFVERVVVTYCVFRDFLKRISD